MNERLIRQTINPDTEVQMVAYLDDVGGPRFFVKTKRGGLYFIDQDGSCQSVPKNAFIPAILNHGYRPKLGEPFAFQDREKYLKIENEGA